MVAPLKHPDPGEVPAVAAAKEQQAASKVPPVFQQASPEVISLHEKCIRDLNLKKFANQMKETEPQSVTIPLLGKIPFPFLSEQSSEKIVAAKKMAQNLPLKKTTGQKINLLTKIIAQIGDQALSWPYQLERARQRLLKKDINEVKAALQDLDAVERVHISPELLLLKAEAYWQLDDWKKAKEAFEKFSKTGFGKTGKAEISFYRALAPLTAKFEEEKEFLEMPEIFRKEVRELCHEAFNKGIIDREAMIDIMAKVLIEQEKLFGTTNQLLQHLKDALKNNDTELFKKTLLIAEFPVQAPLIEELYKDKKLFNALTTLGEFFTSRRDFEFLIEKYVANIKDASGNYSSSLTTQFIIDMMEPKRISQLQKLLQMERERNISLLPIFLEDAARFDGPFLEKVLKNETLSRQIDPETWKVETAFKRYMEWLEKNESKFLKILSLAHEYPGALDTFCSSEELLLGVGTSSFTKLFDKLREMQADPQKTPLIDAWLTLMNNGNILHLNLIPFPEYVCFGILKIVACGEIPLAEELFDKVRNHRDNLFFAKILNIIDATNIPIIKYLLKLYDGKKELVNQDRLIVMAAVKPWGEPFGKEFSILCTLHARGEKDLMRLLEHLMSIPENKRDAGDRLVSSLFLEGHFSLLKDIKDHIDDESWKTLFDGSLDISRVQLLRDLFINLQHLKKPPANLSAVTIAAMEQQALKIAQDKSIAEDWLKGILFEITHHPESIEKKYISSSREVMQSVEKTINEKLSKADNFTTLMVAVAECLTTPEGTINSKLADNIMKALKPHFERLKIQKNIENDFKWLFETMTQDQFFSDRLQALQPPPEDTAQSNLIRSFLKLPPEESVSWRNARVVVLSAILTPVYQGNIGSCFGTAVVRQLMSYKDGLKQTFEDFLCLASDGFITRTNRSGAQPVTVQYPLSFDAEAFQTNYTADHFLSRAREFTIASIAKENNNLSTSLVTPLLFKAMEFLGEEKYKVGTSLAIIVCGVTEEFTKLTAERFLGYAKAAKDDELGVWVIVDRATEKPLAGNPELETILLQALRAYAEGEGKTLLEENPVLKKLVEEDFPKFISSDEYFKDAFGVNKMDFLTTLAFNPKGVPASRFVEFCGASSNEITKTYHECANLFSKGLPKEVTGHPLERFLQKFLNLTPNENAIASSNPHFLKIVCSSNHAMNLRIQPFLNQVKKPDDIAKIMDDVRNANRKFMQIPNTPELQKEIVTNFFVEWSFEEENKLKPVLEAALAKIKPKTLGELSQVLLKITLATIPTMNAHERVRLRILRAMYDVESLKKQLPKMYNVIHPNYLTKDGVAYGLDFDAEHPIAQLMTYDGKLRGWPPWQANEYRYVDFLPITDDISRKYYHV